MRYWGSALQHLNLQGTQFSPWHSLLKEVAGPHVSVIYLLKRVPHLLVIVPHFLANVIWLLTYITHLPGGEGNLCAKKVLASKHHNLIPKITYLRSSPPICFLSPPAIPQGTWLSSLDPAISTCWAPGFPSCPVMSSLAQQPGAAFRSETHFLWLTHVVLTHGVPSYSELIQAPYSCWRPYHLTPEFLRPQFLPTHCHAHVALGKWSLYISQTWSSFLPQKSVPIPTAQIPVHTSLARLTPHTH